jgi:DNA mismatch endonuclease (patch repair protein)
MADVFTQKKRSEVMSRIHGRGNKETEVALAKLLRVAGLRGWRRHQSVFGKPDFIFRTAKLAVFVDGCFWHRCPQHSNMPANNRAFWRRKLSANTARDRLVTRTLRLRGWRVLRIWEHELARKNEARCVQRIKRMLVENLCERADCV